ncbi:MAG: hypothetical protein R6U11_06120 [Bacteroidales bacterium]
MSSLKRDMQNKLYLKLGYQGGDVQNYVYYKEKKGLWFSSLLMKNKKIPKYWNCFGLGLKDNNAVDIIVEINPPLSGCTGKVAGLIAHDDNGICYLMHRGRIGGGKKGIGQAKFMSWYNGETAEVLTCKRKSFNALVVASLESQSITNDIYRFVYKVYQFKKGFTKDSIK